MTGKIIPLEAHGKSEVFGNPLADPGRWPIDTPGGRFYAEWDNQAPVSREGQLMFFF
jgi:hypothetical protein